MENSFIEKMSLKSDEELKDIIENKEDWQPEAVEAASKVLSERESTLEPSVQKTTQSKYKKCPHCAEEILTEAKKCKHCKEDLTTNKKVVINNTFIWLLVFLPIWGTLLEFVLFGEEIYILYFVFHFGLLAIDYSLIRKSESSPDIIVGILLLPVYLVRRSQMQGGSKGYFWIWLVALLLSLFMLQSYGGGTYSIDSIGNMSITNKMSIDELTKEVKKNMTEQFEENQITIKNLTLVKSEGNLYSGLLETSEPNGDFTYAVSVVYDGETFMWEIIE